MERLIGFPLIETTEIAVLRDQVRTAPGEGAAEIALGRALTGQGCTYEASALLRPWRSVCKTSPEAETAKAALAAQTWWRKNWRDFAQLKQAGRREEALTLLGDRAVLFWDLPPLLMHLGGFAAETGRFDLAEHIFQRISDLAKRGLPRMNMTAFAYVAPASLVEVMARRGKVEGSLALHRDLTPNPGNAMTHEIQMIRLLARAARIDDGLSAVAQMLVTAMTSRKGYGREMRLDCADNDADLAPLRAHSDWAELRANPKAYLASLRRQRGRQ